MHRDDDKGPPDFNSELTDDRVCIFQCLSQSGRDCADVVMIIVMEAVMIIFMEGVMIIVAIVAMIVVTEVVMIIVG